MDLPPDKVKVLKSYDDDKKWDMICDQVCAVLLHDSNLLNIVIYCQLFIY